MLRDLLAMIRQSASGRFKGFKTTTWTPMDGLISDTGSIRREN